MSGAGTDAQLVTRPGPGTAGRRIQTLLAFNAHRTFSSSNVRKGLLCGLTCTDDVVIHNARGREDAAPRLKRQVVAELLKQPPFPGKFLVYDGNKIAFVPGQALPFESHKFSVVLAADQNRPAPRDGSAPPDDSWTVRITRAAPQGGAPSAPINLEILRALCNGQSSSEALIAITALNVLLRHGPSHDPNNVVKAASIYQGYPDGQTAPPPDRAYIGGGVELWRGFYSSLRPAPGRLILNVDSTAIAMVRPGNLPEVMGALLNVSDPSRLANLSERDRIVLRIALKGVQVKVMIGASKTPARRKLNEFSPLAANQRRFKDDQGNEHSIYDYFRSLNINLRFPNLGCVRTSKTAWYPIELVTVLPGSKYSRKLNPDQIAKVLEFTSKRPREKRDLIRQGLMKLGYNSNPTVQGWQTALSDQPLQFNARVLAPPTLLAGGPKQAAMVRCKDDGQYDARSKSFFKPATISSWCVIVFDTQQGDGRRNIGIPMPAVQTIVTMLVDACQRKGMQVQNPRPAIAYVGDIKRSEVGKTFFDVISQELKNQKPQFILCLLQSPTAPQYDTIKRLGDTLQGFATQCMVIQKALKRDQSYFQNVALKINMKLGGINQILDRPFPVPGIKDPHAEPIIIFGADVNHAPPGSLNPSVAALVATTDIYSIQYSTQSRAQASRQEIIAELDVMAVQSLRDYYRLTKKQPQRIIFYRDGVSEGQFAAVVLEEVRQLRKACSSLDPNYAPKITYIICGKRHHIRLFPTQAPPPAAKNWQFNVPPGTTIDEGVVHPVNFDWYTVHHAGMLGTSRPTHYTVLVDENGFSADQIQDMSNSLAWLFQRCAKAVNIASPAYFAHLACERASKHLNAARTTDDDTATITTDSDRAEAERNSLLDRARTDLRPYHANLLGTMPWM